MALQPGPWSQPLRIATFVYGATLVGGGVAGYAKKRSKPSLISGLAAGGISVFLAAKPKVFNQQARVPVAVLSFLMAAFFLKRYLGTKKIMPSGALGGVSLLFAILQLTAPE